VNVRRAMDAGDAVEAAGYVAHVPHLSHFRHLHNARPYEHWMRLDLAWLARCDVLVRLPGESPGADREVVEANRLGIPVLVVGEDAWVERLTKLPLRGV
jgi:hypothetical protein